MYRLHLALASLLEVVGTTSMKLSGEFIRLVPSMPVTVCCVPVRFGSITLIVGVVERRHPLDATLSRPDSDVRGGVFAPASRPYRHRSTPRRRLLPAPRGEALR